MKNILLKLEYCGTRYSGWQIQPNALTVEETVRQALQQICRCPIETKACSRTDAGVHARGQVSNAHVPETIKLNKLFFGLNALLPEDISVVDLVQVPEDYSARRESQGKRYIYQISNSPIRRVLDRDMFFWQRAELDVNKMRKSALAFLGTHNFKAFQGKGCQQMNTTKTIHQVSITNHRTRYHHDIKITIEGSGFLKNMIRIMAGTLVDIGRGRLSTDGVSQALKSGQRTDAGLTLPAKGLILDEIFYNPDPFLERELDAWNYS